MFYYPNVLQRHTGCFATIWLAATRGSRLVKREYLKVNVVKTCGDQGALFPSEEILNYLLVRVQPPQPGLPRPRFSLYLSAQLQIGVIRVYSQQCQYLVEDIQHILERLHRVQLQIRIDMVETEIPSLLLPNRLALMETLEDAPDPFFGIMSVDPRLPSPFDIPQIRHLLEAVTPERVLEEAPPEVPTEPGKPVRPLVTVLSPEAITLQEAEPIRMLRIEGERDLPEISRRDLDLLIAEEDEAILLEERGRLIWQCRAWLVLDSQAADTGNLDLVFKEEPRVPEMEITVPPLSPIALARVEGAAEPLPGPVLAPEELKPAVWEPEALLAELLAFWTHCAQPPPRALRRMPPLEPEEEEAAEREAAAEEERRKAETLSDIEVLREAQEPSGPLMLSSVALELQANREPDFNSLVSPLSPRRVAARVFYLLLVLATQQILRIEQEKPYGRLLIQPGPRFHSS
ncbi:Meiotic recombination protein REC8 like protein [Pteropus alecto]|uniref:Meiotic recombination protein REC8 like protein n=1 Tax=Pteropus alecto TaxID=9402 RepID=L5KHR0_PTEAL|nr:Meiotic recombination protein REC8 like protein [Pteropus alecto]